MGGYQKADTMLYKNLKRRQKELLKEARNGTDPYLKTVSGTQKGSFRSPLAASGDLKPLLLFCAHSRGHLGASQRKVSTTMAQPEKGIALGWPHAPSGALLQCAGNLWWRNLAQQCRPLIRSRDDCLEGPSRHIFWGDMKSENRSWFLSC